VKRRRLARVRRWEWLAIAAVAAVAWLLNVSRAGTGVSGCPAACATTVERLEGPVRVMSLNVLHGFPRFEHLRARLDRIADEVRCQDADVVCLQEVPWTPWLGDAAAYIAARTGLNHVYLRANGNRWAILFEEGEAILSRYPLRDAGFVELSPRAGPFEHRVALRATAVTPWGDLRVFVTHLTNGDPGVNRAQAASLMAFVAASGEGPAVVAGDFNATEGTDQVRMLSARWVDTYRVAHPDDAGLTCCVDDLHAGPDEALEKRIDYLFLLPGPGHTVGVAGSRRVLDRPARMPDGGWLWASDHVGLMSELVIKEVGAE